ncbi:MAG: aconitase X catalytic domain-containing protein [Thermofilaceae archaeon]|nr:aconitase X catalytic domain-containing protein [Thermofilaceae archaeon]MCX8180836.1 aconitase X catalytic domain-containing protein [Thermofilaceae archaeon]MDW8004622.1 aconitase X catalytic domain-containing protein [Thermofilaceae archaeon]
MFLTRKEEEILNGVRGEGLALAMETVVKVAEVLGATRLVEISSAHVSGVSYKNLGEEGVEFIEKLADKGLRFAVPTTVNPAGFDTCAYAKMGVGSREYQLQMRVITALSSMGAKVILSCIPYITYPPKYGDHLAWAESNAVLYANSVIGARTNREGGPFSILEALVGRAPYVGLHTKEGRAPTIAVDMQAVREFVEEKGYYSALGYLLGSIVKTGIPLVYNPPNGLRRPSNVRLFLASVGASSSIGLTLIEGVSPEFRRVKGLEMIDMELKDLFEITEKWRSEEVDAIVIGCPHLSPGELVELLNLLKGKRVNKRLMVFTSRWSIIKAAKVVRELENLGVEVYADTCMVVGDLSTLGLRSCATDSAKAAYYLTNQGYVVYLASRNELLDLATS